MATATRTVTYEEYLSMPECELGKEEVVDGEIITIPPAAPNHAILINEFLRQINPALPKQRFTILGSSFGIVIRREPLAVRNPDIAIFHKERCLIVDKLVQSAPQLVIEVLSPSNTRREMGRRLHDYADIGVPEVWLVSLEAQSIETLILHDAAYSEHRFVNEGEISPVEFPQLKIRIAELWD